MDDWTLSRRKFIRGAMATSVAAMLTGCGGGSGSAPAVQQTPSTQSSSAPTPAGFPVLDVIVVGAGAAGIGAARAVQSLEGSVVILEAQAHIGGRCRSDNTFPVPYDYGAQFMAQSQSLNNVLYPIAQQLGITIIPAEQVPFGFFDPNTGLSADPTQVAEFLSTYAALDVAIQTSGPTLSTGTPDLSIQDLINNAGLQNAPFLSLALQFLMEVVDGGSAATQSTLDLYNVTQFIPAPFLFPPKDSLFIPSGYGNFLARLADGLPILTNMPVTSVDRSGTNVVVTAGGQQFTARTVILTPSVNVLKSGSIAFNPPLPAAYVSALSQVLMGHTFKAQLEFSSDPFNGRLGVQPGQMFQALPLNDGNSPAFMVNYFAQQFTTPNTYVMAFVEADQALALESMGPAQAGATLCAQLETPFPGATAAWTGQILASNWGSNPYTQGCLSYCTPGNAEARIQLAQSIDNKLWFAGEALGVHDHSLVHGAWASGEQAAYGAMGVTGALSQM